jgi:hypothetical protein
MTTLRDIKWKEKLGQLLIKRCEVHIGGVLVDSINLCKQCNKHYECYNKNSEYCKQCNTLEKIN